MHGVCRQKDGGKEQVGRVGYLQMKLGSRQGPDPTSHVRLRTDYEVYPEGIRRQLTAFM